VRNYYKLKGAELRPAVLPDSLLLITRQQLAGSWPNFHRFFLSDPTKSM